MIQLANITKRFHSIPALENVSLQILPAQIHGLLGENGAGKSTLMNILFGLLQPDSGQILIHQKPTRIPSPRAAQKLGIGMVHQHFKLVPTLTVLENLSLALHASTKKIRPRAQEKFAQLQWPINLDAPIDSLSVGHQQRVEITKALLAITPPIHNSEFIIHNSVLILDEPTAVLTPQETAELFTALQTLKQTNTAILFISHKLNEVQKICDQITILRRGKFILTAPTADLTPSQMAEKMVGSHVELPALNRTPGVHALACPPPILELKNLSSGILKEISLTVSPGQILGIAGVDGNGQADLVQAIVGATPLTSGSLFLNNHNATHDSIRTRMSTLSYIAEDRHKQAVVLPLSITENLLLKDYRRPPFSTLGWLRFSQWKKHAQQLRTQFDIRTASLSDPVARLSGGNQQKVVLARELYNPEKPLILAVNPTRGLDIGATAFVMNQLLTARARGAAILLIHSDLDELLAISDQVSVLYNGTLTPTPWPHTTKDQIGHLMLGLPSLKGDAA